MEFSKAMIGKPFIWKTSIYGTVAVHVTGLSPNGAVAVLSIDGGGAATPAQRFPELADGIGYAITGQLSKRARGVAVPKTTTPAGPTNQRSRKPRSETAVRFKVGEVTF